MMLVKTCKLRSPFKIRGRSAQLDGPVGGDNHVAMYVILWRFRLRMGRESEFERAYGLSGEWALLFRRGEGYLGTELLQRSDDSREYLTLDRWASRDAYEAFRACWSSEYRRLDRPLEELTEEEEALLGAFEVLP
jgi:heme-degrading monooxygenase HmoA